MAPKESNYTPYRKRRGKKLPQVPYKRRLARMDVGLGLLLVILVSLLLSRFSPEGQDAVDITDEQQQTSPDAADCMPGGNTQDSAAQEETRPQKTAGNSRAAKAGAPVCFLMQNVNNYFVSGERQRSRYSNAIKKEADREAVADTIASVKPEIIGLVEMGGPKALDDLAKRLEARGLSYPYRFVLTRDGEDRALAVLSRYPFTNNSKADYPLFGTHNRKMLRGILDVTVRLPDNREFRILGAHLKSHVGNSEAETANLRRQEARTVALYVEKIMKTNPNTLIAVYGDWNDGPADGTLGILKQGTTPGSALSRLTAKDDRGEEWTHHYKAGGEYLIYDQIYVNAPLKKRMGRKSKVGVIGTPGAYGSDHRAVWCELR